MARSQIVWVIESKNNPKTYLTVDDEDGPDALTLKEAVKFADRASARLIMKYLTVPENWRVVECEVG